MHKYLDIVASVAQANSSRKAGDPSANNYDFEFSVIATGIYMTGSGSLIKTLCERSHGGVKHYWDSPSGEDGLI